MILGSESYSLGILPKQSTLVNTMLLRNGYLIFLSLRAHFSCKISIFSSLCVVKFTVQSYIPEVNGLIALDTEIYKQCQKGNSPSPHAFLLWCVLKESRAEHSGLVCSLDAYSGHAPFHSLCDIYTLLDEGVGAALAST